MKKRSFFIAIACLVIAFTACRKDKPKPISPTPPIVNPEILTASKTSGIEKGEPILFTLTNAPIASTVTWSVSPTTAQLTETNSDTVESVLFTQAGQYTITASIGSVVITDIVTVADSIYHSPSDPFLNPDWNNLYDTTSVLSGDALNITPSFAGDSLAIYTITNDTYNCINNYLDMRITPDLSDYYSYPVVGFPMGSACGGGEKRASSLISLFIPPDNQPHNITMTIYGLASQGTITRSTNGNTYTFTNLTSAISPYAIQGIVSPLSITR
jgi:hypothetical protein